VAVPVQWDGPAPAHSAVSWVPPLVSVTVPCAGWLTSSKCSRLSEVSSPVSVIVDASDEGAVTLDGVPDSAACATAGRATRASTARSGAKVRKGRDMESAFQSKRFRKPIAYVRHTGCMEPRDDSLRDDGPHVLGAEVERVPTRQARFGSIAAISGAAIANGRRSRAPGLLGLSAPSVQSGDDLDTVDA
jgi:hypothetical protein